MYIPIGRHSPGQTPPGQTSPIHPPRKTPLPRQTPPLAHPPGRPPGQTPPLCRHYPCRHPPGQTPPPPGRQPYVSTRTRHIPKYLDRAELIFTNAFVMFFLLFSTGSSGRTNTAWRHQRTSCVVSIRNRS